MNWEAVSFNWNHVRAFLAVAEEGSLSAAARALGQTQPTLSRQVIGLEDALAVTLFDRVGKALILTPAGHDLLVHVREMADAASRLSLAATGQGQSLEGHVTVTASDITSLHLLPPHLARLQDIAPGIRVTVKASNDLQDLRRREADIALRNVRPVEAELIARRLPDMAGAFYASPAYVARFKSLASLKDIGPAKFVGYAPAQQMVEALAGFGIPLRDDQLVALSDSGVAMWEMVRQGMGIGVILRALGDRDPAVVRVMTDAPLIPVEHWITCHREVQTSRIIRVVFDHLADAFQRPATPRGG